MTRVAVATSNHAAAEAGEWAALEGGNAVDAAVAAMAVSLINEPGVCAPGAGGFVTVWPADQPPVTIDGYVEMPGRSLPPDRFGGGIREVTMGYGGGVTTLVGPGSVGTPGAIAALWEASHTYGRLPWREVWQPTIELAHEGFPLSQPAADYLEHAHEVIFGFDEDSRRALHHADGRPLQRGETVQIEHLADSLDFLATEGVRTFYEGELARAITDAVESGGGILTRSDMSQYEPEKRQPQRVSIGGWDVATNPLPAVGGSILAAMLLLCETTPAGGTWSSHELRHLVDVQRAVLEFRKDHIDNNEDATAVISSLLTHAARGDLIGATGSPSTVHTSAVDADGLACAITMSAGYGSGVMPTGTGMWLNNCLGELELTPAGLHQDPPGRRLLSNMAPTIARHHDGRVLAIGSPGADRITTALLQVLLNVINGEMSLSDAVDHPRVHVEVGSQPRVAAEAPLDTPDLGLPVRPFENLHMFFGGVGAALFDGKKGFEVAADPRRSGATAVAGHE